MLINYLHHRWFCAAVKRSRYRRFRIDPVFVTCSTSGEYIYPSRWKVSGVRPARERIRAHSSKPGSNLKIRRFCRGYAPSGSGSRFRKVWTLLPRSLRSLCGIRPQGPFYARLFLDPRSKLTASHTLRTAYYCTHRIH